MRSKKPEIPLILGKSGLFISTPHTIRTCNLRFRASESASHYHDEFRLLTCSAGVKPTTLLAFFLHELHVLCRGKEADARPKPQQGQKDRWHDDGIVVGQVGYDRAAPIGGGHQHSNGPDSGEQQQSATDDGRNANQRLVLNQVGFSEPLNHILCADTYELQHARQDEHDSDCADQNSSRNFDVLAFVAHVAILPVTVIRAQCLHALRLMELYDKTQQTMKHTATRASSTSMIRHRSGYPDPQQPPSIMNRPLCMTSVLATLFLLPAVALAEATPPNIMIIMVDDMGYSDLGCYGGEIETPNIDQLAANGLRFTQFYNCAKCETTRATLLSGRYFPEVGGGKLAECITIPEAMRTAGYETMMVGKWHQSSTPTERGFDRYFGFLNGCVNFFTGVSSQKNGTHFMLDGERWQVPKSDFYTTDAFTDYTLKFLDQRDQKKPFFFYIAHNAPHYPLQAPEEDVAKYRGRYKQGWHELRKQRLARMIELGVVPKDQELSVTPSNVLTWDTLTEQEIDHHDLMMATYAAMIDKVDRSVGAVVAKLEEQDVLDNTLIIFLSDNGACPFQRTEAKTRENNLMPWDPESWWLYDHNWAHACNTPYRKYKQNQHEGGISTAMIMHWPAALPSGGRFDREPAHLVDLHATCLELAGINYDDLQKGRDIGPARGLSLAAAMQGKKRELHTELYFVFNRYSALRAGDWKLVDGKELYKIDEDRIEKHNLADDHPERFEAMKTRWQQLHTEFGGNKNRK